MKTKTIVQEITHEDLVNLFSTALYGSSWLGASYDGDTYLSLAKATENDCFEDKLAKMLLSGHTIKLMDYYAEDDSEYYGNHIHEYCEGCMEYTISLDDVKEGLQLALNDDDSWHRECAQKLIYDDAYDLDQPRAEVLCQLIMFGEEVYG